MDKKYLLKVYKLKSLIILIVFRIKTYTPNNFLLKIRDFLKVYNLSIFYYKNFISFMYSR